MLGSTFATPDISGLSIGEYPDVSSHVVTLALQNQDGFASQYGYKGNDYSYKLLVRNSRESPKAGQVSMTRHNVEFHMIRSRIQADDGSVSVMELPFILGITFRRPTVELSTVDRDLVHVMSAVTAMSGSDGLARWRKLINFES